MDQSNLLNLYLLPTIPSVRPVFILEFHLGKRNTGALFQDINPEEYKGLWNFVDTPQQADFFLFPHTYVDIKQNRGYIDSAIALAKEHSKTLILFATQDKTETIEIPRTIVIRPSQYKSKQKPYEIIMPGIAEDLGKSFGISYRKKQEKISIGFVGKAGFESLSHRIRYAVKNLLLRRHPEKNGIYYRRKAIRALSVDRRIQTAFIVRSSYSGNKKSIPVDPRVARKEYVENLQNTDLALSVRGDGNYSCRLFEAFSLARIPVLIDTDSVLPLEEKVPYNDICIKVHYSDIARLPDIITTVASSWSQEEFEEKQKKAREMFERYLYMPAFIKTVFNRNFLSSIEQHTLT